MPQIKYIQIRCQSSILLLSAITLLSGCSGLPIKEASDSLQTRQVCCTSYHSVNYTPIKIGSRQKLSISMESPVMAFSRGNAFFAAISLPQGSKSLVVQTMETEYLPKTSYLDPGLVVLDKNFTELGSFDELQLDRGKHVIIPGLWEWNFNARITLPSGAAYIIIYGDPTSKRVRRVYSDNGTPWPVPPATIGSLAVVLE